MTFDKKLFAIGVILGLCFSVVVWAQTIDMIWQAVYDSVNQAIRINQVHP